VKREQTTYRNLKPLAEAKKILFCRFRDSLVGSEIMPVRNALGRYLAVAVRASRSVPAYHGAAVDGVAVKAARTATALPESPVLLRRNEEAVPVNTGDALPAGSDAVVMIEKVFADGDMFEVREAVYPWQNVRKAGEDMVKGETLFPALHCVRSYDQAALLAAGILSVKVIRRPRVLIIPTGDEIVQPENAARSLRPGCIIEVNGQMLASGVVEAGGEAIISEVVPDVLDRLKEAIAQATTALYDLILIIAGSSAGSKDHTPAALSESGELLVHGVTVMPGKPTLLAAVKGKPVIGVPGYPVSAAIAFREFVRPLLYRMQGIRAPEPETVEAVLGRKLPSRPGLEEHVRVVVGKVGPRMVAVPLSGGAGVMSSLVRSDGILRVRPEVSGYSEGDKVEIELLTPAGMLGNRLLAIGSHDLTIDLLSSLLKETSAGRITISSSNVGSLGGLLAVDRGIAHFAGAHLLETETGDYNRSYVRKYVTRTAVTIVTLVHRWQGLMVARGNPKSIAGIADLARQDVSFINRQAGSGTRILVDYELGRAAIDPAAITGYRTEEYTHMGLAMAVASGRADVGMGIKAAATALELDFVPVTRERYDLVIPHTLTGEENMTRMLDMINSSRFQHQVLALGGYDVEETGRIVSL
jgi:molybdenum cofactor synthesis domain-containing protein